MKEKEYKIGDIINIDDVNHIKNKLYKEEYAKLKYEPYLMWCKTKKSIKKDCQFKIVSLFNPKRRDYERRNERGN